jgi:hypothetical protein
MTVIDYYVLEKSLYLQYIVFNKNALSNIQNNNEGILQYVL